MVHALSDLKDTLVGGIAYKKAAATIILIL